MITFASYHYYSLDGTQRDFGAGSTRHRRSAGAAAVARLLEKCVADISRRLKHHLFCHAVLP